MKKIYFVRHAKSSWDDISITDKERTLNERGQRDAPRMAQFISDKISCPDAFICSSAVRTTQTAKIFVSQFEKENLILEDRLYNASEVDWFSVLKNIDASHASVMIFGHNPEITNLVNVLADANIMNMPTCAVAAVNFEMETWKEIMDVEGKLDFYHFPKGIK